MADSVVEPVHLELTGPHVLDRAVDRQQVPLGQGCGSRIVADDEAGHDPVRPVGGDVEAHAVEALRLLRPPYGTDQPLASERCLRSTHRGRKPRCTRASERWTLL